MWQLSDVFALRRKLLLIRATDRKSRGRGGARGVNLGSQFDVVRRQV